MPTRVLFVTALVIPVAAGCSNGSRAQGRGRTESARRISVERVREEDIHRTVEVVGTLAAVDEVTISSEADGVVSRIVHDLGDRVSKGDVLIELDREKAQYAADQQRAALARALAQYGAPDPEHLPAVEDTPDVKKANADLAQAQQAFERASELYKKQLVPKQTLDDAETALQSKRASYDSALQNARNLRANIAAADAAAKLAERQLRDTAIRAPFDGYVAQRFVNLGQFVKGSSPSAAPVISVVRTDPLKVTAEIPEKMTPWIQVGQPADLHVDPYPDQTFTGKVSRISPAVNTSTRAFPFEALVPNPDGRLKPGTFARVRIVSGKVDRVVTVPYASLQYRYGVSRVFVVSGDRLSARELKTGDRLGDRIEVVSGVKAGETVASADVDRLDDGTRVSVQKDVE